MEMKLRPLGARVIVRLVTQPERIGTIFLPENGRELPHRGTVVAVGQGRERPNGTRIPSGVQVGDHIIWNRYAEVPVMDTKNTIKNTGTLVAISQEEILGVLDGACCPYPSDIDGVCSSCGGVL